MAKNYNTKIIQGLALDTNVIETVCQSAVGKGEIVELSLVTGTCIFPTDNDVQGPFVVAMGTYAAAIPGRYKIKGYVQAVCGTAVVASGLQVTPMLNKGFAERSAASSAGSFAVAMENGTSNWLSWINIL